MTYINMKKQGLNKTIPISKKSGDLGVTPVKTKEPFCVPTWGIVNNYLYNLVAERNEDEKDLPVYNTLWIGKDIVPDVRFITGTWRDYPSYTITVLKSLAFEDGRTDDLLSNLLGNVNNVVRIAKSIRFPEGTTASIISKIQLGKFINYEDDITSEDLDIQDDKCSWNVYLPGTLSEINFNILNNLLGRYVESSGVDRQVHIYLDRHTSVPTIYRATVPVLDDAPAVYVTDTNIYFHVNADIYDDFVAAYDGWFRGIVKIKSEADSWLATRPEIVKTGSYDSLIDRPFYSEEVIDETFNLKSSAILRIEDDYKSSGELFSLIKDGGYSVTFHGTTYNSSMEGLHGTHIIANEGNSLDETEIVFIGNIKSALTDNRIQFELNNIDPSFIESLPDSDLPFCFLTSSGGSNGDFVWFESDLSDDESITISQDVLDQELPTYTLNLYEARNDNSYMFVSHCVLPGEYDDNVKKFNAEKGNEISVMFNGKKISAVWDFSHLDGKDSATETFSADFEGEDLKLIIERQYYDISQPYNQRAWFTTESTDPAQVFTLKTVYHTLDDNFLSENIARKSDLPEPPEPVVGVTKKTLLTMDLTRVVSEESGNTSFHWDHNLDSNQFSIADDGPDFNFNLLVEESSPVENPLESFYPPEGLITVEYDGNTYVGTPYIVYYEKNDDFIAEDYLIGPVQDDWSPEDSGLPSGTTIPEDQQSWPFFIQFSIGKNSDGSEIIRGLTSIFTDFFFGFMDDVDNIEVGTKSLSIKIDSNKVKKLDKEFIPQLDKEHLPDDVVKATSDIVKVASDTEKLMAFMNDKTTRILNLDHIDFVFLEPQDLSSKVVLGYDDSQSTEFVMG